ncbi:restriction endonuclease subunit S [Pectobacterium sp. A535-S3-A17]|uniref:restriction endonuclease subunit S n=1 Tax=Pectobacterium quasiaquaticum TaxID=2774015 RepID=UPI0018757FDD|nr:restriction endonuclease subunit S [Pectobacterium quasiaquaticum]MBE5215222.1 restriction endonuclease subunit S [Pectobacterium quasiaquaticum]MBE5225108.1 restriction endonuclease subunit S [Pectobacterium quasiaquaticum]
MVPEGWKVAQLGELAKFASGGTPSKQNLDFWEGEEPWISGKDLKSHYLNSSIDKLTLKGFLAAKKAPKGSSLILVRGMTLLKDFPVGYVTREVAFNQDLKALIPNKNIDGLFLSFLLVAEKEKILKLVSIAGHGTGRLDTNLIKSFPVNTPPYGEQKKIAQILSTWDKTITITEQLLANSQKQKKALMQQFVTGKSRFPEFTGAWREYYLTDIAKIIISPVDKKSEEGEVPVRLCNYTDVYYNNEITKKLNFMSATAKQSEIDRYTLHVGDVIITKDSETPGDIAIPALVSEDLNGVICGYHLAIIRPHRTIAHGAFLNHLFNMHKTRYYFFTLATGATRFGLSVGGINKAHFMLPPLEEQKKIASVLSIADQAIEALKQKLNHLKQEKKALMQQLLTGKRRVKTEAA